MAFPFFSDITKDDFKVVVGEHNLMMDGDEQEYHDVKEIIIHPEFNLDSFENDFALLKLVKLVTISKKASVINLSNKSLLDLVGKTYTLFGWGLNENDTVSSEIRSVEMEVMTNLLCENSFDQSKVKYKSLTSNHMCALRTKKGSATCTGDSGGKNLLTNLFD
jgi:secreted trypsin-like serine protease